MPAKQKIINDPVYGFITINHPLIFDIISHPYYQRLRRIKQMAMAQLGSPAKGSLNDLPNQRQLRL